MLGIIEALPSIDAPAGPGPEIWEQYSELLDRDKPTAAEKKQFVALAEKLHVTAEVAELHKAVLEAAAAREEILRDIDASEAHAAEREASAAEAKARHELQQRIYQMKWQLDHNDFPEAAAYTAARSRCAAIKTADEELGACHSCFPQLFGLGMPPTRETPHSGLPAVVTAVLTRKALYPLVTGRPNPPVIE
jgi:hypothetical protein